jgi:osmoprotectant transport system ATP-binding protein
MFAKPSNPRTEFGLHSHLFSHAHNRQEATVHLSYLSFREVSYCVDGRTILDRLCLDVERGETLVLLGRSGSGKTTALRLINRMLEPTGGKIWIDGQDITGINAIELRRRVGYVIQEFGLLPHWTIEQNVALVPRLLGWPPDKQRTRARELLEQVGLQPDELGNRLPHQLSGGQRQRAAVARALAAEPPLLLFDEPFGALDPVTRHEMQQQFIALRSRYNVASVFVTHDIVEALSIATRIAVLDRGKLEIVATPDEFFGVTTPVARAFLDTLPVEMWERRET